MSFRKIVYVDQEPGFLPKAVRDHLASPITSGDVYATAGLGALAEGVRRYRNKKKEQEKKAAAFSESEYNQTLNYYKKMLKKNPNNKAMRKDYDSLVANKSSLVKKASVAQLSALGRAVEQGHFGKEAQYAFEGMTSAIYQYVDEDLSEKTASYSENDYNIYDENAARIARLNTLLRKL